MVTMVEAQVSNVWENVSFDRARKLLAEAPDDLMIALNCLPPGAEIEMHFHVGSGQSYLVLKGSVVIRHRHKELPEERTAEVTLKEGDCILIPAEVYYQWRNPGPDEAILYQVKHPGNLISVEGKGVMDTSQYFGGKGSG